MVRFIFYTKNNQRREAEFNITEDDNLELISIRTLNDKNSKEYNKYISSFNDKTEQLTVNTKKGFGELIASFTKLFGFKTCAPCNKRRQYLNKITPQWIANILSKLYK
jgi:hypothetical protein